MVCWRLREESGEVTLKHFIRPADKNLWCLWRAEVLKTSCTLMLLSLRLFELPAVQLVGFHASQESAESSRDFFQ